MSRPSDEDRFGHLFALIGDPVVELELVDGVPVVRAVNPAFEEVFGYDRERVLDESLNEFIVPEDREGEATRFDRRTAENKPNTGVVTRETDSGPRKFLYRGFPYERDGRQYAFAIYTDVTTQRRYERHVEVVHRLLRHDLRTDLQVIMGAARQIRDRASDDALVELAQTVTDRADQLATVGEEAKHIEQVLLDDHNPEPIDVAAICRGAVADRRDAYPDVTIDVSAPDEQLATGTGWLRTAVGALVDNGAIYGGGSVRVAVRQRGDRIELEVADDGPGIPEEVRAPIFENRDVTQLEHSSGLGLWLVRWVTEICGGRLEYDRTGGWTAVRIHLQPAAKAVETPPALD